MDTATCRYYLRLIHSKTLPIPIFSRLLIEFGSVTALCAEPRSTYQSLGCSEAQIDLLQGSRGTGDSERQVEAALKWSTAADSHLLCFESEHYPSLLREIDSAPPLLFVRGSPAVLKERLFSIVGSRNASIYGKRNAYWMAREVSRAGLHISSGLARGIDTQAHEGALDGGGTTIAVVGTGIDRVYPCRNAALVERIVERGALVSEFPLGTAPYPSNFPRRNRIISGMAVGTLVVEGNIKSGSLITARLAMEQNRDVFALPGAIGSTGSRGCHQLIKQGAKLVEEPADILEELGLTEAPPNGGSETACKLNETSGVANSQESRVLSAIGRQGSLFEAILIECKLDRQGLNTVLIELEAAGAIQQQGGRYFRHP